MYERDSYADKVDLAKACLIGLCANIEAPHYKPREMAARALDLANAFYDELDAREQAAIAKEAEAELAGDTEPPPENPDVSETGETEPATPEGEAEVKAAETAAQEPIRPWTGGDLARA